MSTACSCVTPTIAVVMLALTVTAWLCAGLPFFRSNHAVPAVIACFMSPVIASLANLSRIACAVSSSVIMAIRPHWHNKRRASVFISSMVIVSKFISTSGTSAFADVATIGAFLRGSKFFQSSFIHITYCICWIDARG